MTKIFNIGDVNPKARKQRIKEIIMALSPEKQKILKEKSDSEQFLKVTEEINLIFNSLYSRKYEGFRYFFGEILYSSDDLKDRVKTTILIWDTLKVIDEFDRNIIIDLTESVMSLGEVAKKYGITVNDVLFSINNTLGYIKHINFVMSKCSSKYRKIESIYTTLGQYSEVDVDWAINKLSPAHKKILYSVHGLNLHEPGKVNIDNVPYSTYVMHILPLLSSLLAKKNNKVTLNNVIKIEKVN